MNAEPNVTPFLDVLLVLLILFMVRPKAMYAINTQVVAASELEARLRAIYAGRPAKTIVVRAAPGVKYQDVVTAIDVAKGAGVIGIGLK